MAKSEQNEILKMIEGLPAEEQAAIIQALIKDEPKKKVRRKHYKKEERESPPTPPPATQEPRQQRRKRPFVNEFEKSPLFNSHKEDNNVDKILWGKHKPTERDRAPARYVSVNCSSCGKQEKVLNNLIHKTGRGGPDETSAYYCNQCITKRK